MLSESFAKFELTNSRLLVSTGNPKKILYLYIHPTTETKHVFDVTRGSLERTINLGEQLKCVS